MSQRTRKASLSTPAALTTAECELWMRSRGWEPFAFQKSVWSLLAEGQSGLLHSGTGTGKTLAAWLGALLRESSISKNLTPSPQPAPGILWITPLRALAADTERALNEPLPELHPSLTAARWTGDVPSSARQRLKKHPPRALIITPESLCLLLSQPEWLPAWQSLHTVIVDEWHELLGSKRGVLLELALARLRALSATGLCVWGLSATLGNLDQAATVLAGWHNGSPRPIRLIAAKIEKPLTISSVLPEPEQRFPWAGHLGLHLLPAVITRLETAASALLFTNTRAQAELWHHALLESRPDWRDRIGLHHGSLDAAQRKDVEDGLREGRLRVVVATSSLDLGVDFSPVDLVFQIGSPKGIARLLQRAGRSGHRPGAPSEIVCVPANTFELLEIAAARSLAAQSQIESRPPLELSLDALCQHILTVAAGGGFEEEALFAEITTTHAFRNLTREQFHAALRFAASGGDSLKAYPGFQRLEKHNGRWLFPNRKLLLRHRMSLGAITSDPVVEVRLINGQSLGTMEESAAARIPAGGRFLFAGKLLECLRIREGRLEARIAKRPRSGQIMTPRWMGGKMPLSTCLASGVRRWLASAADTPATHTPPPRSQPIPAEIQRLQSILDAQRTLSAIPGEHQFLIETMRSREGVHLYFYPFEGWLAHQGLAALWAWRLTRGRPATLTWAVNDYGLELLSPEDHLASSLPAALPALLSPASLEDDILASLNATEMCRRKFREIARVAGLVFEGYPGTRRIRSTARQQWVSSSLLFEVFRRYEPGHFLLEQARREVLENELELSRIRAALHRLAACEPLIRHLNRPSPLCFPLLVERLREQLSTETLQERALKIQQEIETATPTHPAAPLA